MDQKTGQSILTKYMDYCLICGKPRHSTHHLLSGIANRQLSDRDKVIIPLCFEHHTGKNGIHHIREFEVMGKIVGQIAWEKHQFLLELAKEKVLKNPTGKDWAKEIPAMKEKLCDEVRQAFIDRYGKSML